MIMQELTLIRGEQKQFVFEFNTNNYEKYQFVAKNPDGAVILIKEGTSENNNWQLEITDTDLTLILLEVDTQYMDVGNVDYSLNAINSTSGEWEKVYYGRIVVSLGNEVIPPPIIWEEGRIGRTNKLISEITTGVNYDIIKDSTGNYYLNLGNSYKKISVES